MYFMNSQLQSLVFSDQVVRNDMELSKKAIPSFSSSRTD